MPSFEIDPTAHLAQKSLGALWAQQRLITENIANVSTPGYKARHLSFEAYLRGAMNGATADPMAFVRSSPAASQRSDGNNVDLEAELVTLAENSLRYRSIMGQLQRKIDTLNSVVRE